MANVPSRVVELVETFEQHVEAYHSQQYNETQLRREFIDPFFEELGWDVTNKAGYAQAYKDVIHEYSLKVGGATEAPDYCFRIGGVRKFFLEAKKPSVDIKGDPHPAYQLRRYAWSAKLPLSVLTDFEEFAVYDCRIRPRHTDKADAARIMLFSYKDYLKKWSEIADIFTKEAILKGSFDKFAAATKGKRGTSTVDKEFLSEIETWRGMLARIIALRNRTLSVREINFAVQRTIDRILFLRMCEDRGIELYGQLQAISSGERTYPRLCEVFERADQRYNSGLFHFHDEPDRPEPPDEMTPNLAIDDKDLKWILHSLYYPQSPYEFSVLPAEILGNVYEQFLGKVITLSLGHRATVEDKPEVKKAGGVYYTPSYIVDYIVKNTVGRLLGDSSAGHCEEACPERSRMGGNLNSLTPKQVSNIKILDPACGSGSFLIGAYQYLLDWHLKYYTENDPEKHAKGRDPKIHEANSIRHCEEPGDAAISNYRLTIAEKKRILLSNIFGVDIDSQAVEVTKLSLLLKVLEGESSETIENQYRLFHERALPDLAANIKCGNSLIGPDFFDTPVIANKPLALSKVEGEAEESTKTDGWQPQAKLGDGESSNLDDLRDKINAFDWHAEFPEIFTRQNPGFDAVIGNPPYGAELTLEERKYLRHISKCGSTDTAALFVEHATSHLNSTGRLGFIIPKPFVYASNWEKLRQKVLPNLEDVVDVSKVWKEVKLEQCIILLSVQNKTERYNCSIRKETSIESLGSIEKSLVNGFGFILSGISPSDVDVALRLRKTCVSLSLAGQNKRGAMLQSLIKGDGDRIVLGGKHIQRWYIRPDSNNRANKSSIKDDKAFIKRNSVLVQNIVAHIQNPIDHIKITATVLPESELGKYLILDTVNQLECAPCVHANYICAILNSRFLNWYAYRFLFAKAIRTMHFDAVTTNKLLIPELRHVDRAKQTRIIQLVEQVGDLYRQLDNTRTTQTKTEINRMIEYTTREIDLLVYEIYGLNESEIELVESSSP